MSNDWYINGTILILSKVSSKSRSDLTAHYIISLIIWRVLTELDGKTSSCRNIISEPIHTSKKKKNYLAIQNASFCNGRDDGRFKTQFFSSQHKNLVPAGLLSEPIQLEYYQNLFKLPKKRIKIYLVIESASSCKGSHDVMMEHFRQIWVFSIKITQFWARISKSKRILDQTNHLLQSIAPEHHENIAPEHRSRTSSLQNNHLLQNIMILMKTRTFTIEIQWLIKQKQTWFGHFERWIQK